MQPYTMQRKPLAPAARQALRAQRGRGFDTILGVGAPPVNAAAQAPARLWVPGVEARGTRPGFARQAAQPSCLGSDAALAHVPSLLAILRKSKVRSFHSCAGPGPEAEDALEGPMPMIPVGVDTGDRQLRLPHKTSLQ